MKKLLVVAVLSIFTAQAHATKARVNSLLGARHLVDSQAIFNEPNQINQLPQHVALEFGPTGQGTTNPKAEGGLFRKGESLNYGLYLGHADAYQALGRGTTFPLQTNPLQFFVGSGNWGLTVGLSNTDKKTTKEKETTLYAGFGMDLGALDWAVNLQGISSASKTTAGVESKYTGMPTVQGQVEYDMGTYFTFAEVLYGNLETETAGTKAKTKDLGVELGVLDRSIQNVYYGISLAYADRDADGKKRNSMSLPVVLGVEEDINTWATARASLRQNFLLGSTKDEIPPSTSTESDTIANNTTVAAGLGFKWNKFVLDGTLAAASSGDLNGSSFLANAGLLYNF